MSKQKKNTVDEIEEAIKNLESKIPKYLALIGNGTGAWTMLPCYNKKDVQSAFSLYQLVLVVSIEAKSQYLYYADFCEGEK